MQIGQIAVMQTAPEFHPPFDNPHFFHGQGKEPEFPKADFFQARRSGGEKVQNSPPDLPTDSFCQSGFTMHILISFFYFDDLVKSWKIRF
jgi:hypothetical protein